MDGGIPEGVPDNIMQRIQKLLKLAADAGATEDEATLAATRAREMMMKYKVDLTAVNRSFKVVDAYEIVEQSYGVGDERWRGDLLAVVASKFMCRIYFRGSYANAQICGSKDDAQIVLVMFEWLAEQVVKLGMRGWLEYEIKYLIDNQKPLRKNDKAHKDWLDGFRAGVVSRIRQRMNEEQKKDEEEVRALVVSRDTELQAYMSKLHLVAGSAPRYKQDAYGAGVKAGDRINLGGRPAALGGARGLIGDGR